MQYEAHVLSSASPTEPMDGTMPSAARWAVNAMQVYCDPASEWQISPPLTGCPPWSRCHSAMSRASSTSLARLWRAAAQPVNMREKISTANAT